jgi:hypothetical protein
MSSGLGQKLSGLGQKLSEDVFMEALDCFVAFAPHMPSELVSALGQIWNLPQERISFYLTLYKPRYFLQNVTARVVLWFLLSHFPALLLFLHASL